MMLKPGQSVKLKDGEIVTVERNTENGSAVVRDKDGKRFAIEREQVVTAPKSLPGVITK